MASKKRENRLTGEMLLVTSNSGGYFTKRVSNNCFTMYCDCLADVLFQEFNVTFFEVSFAYTVSFLVGVGYATSPNQLSTGSEEDETGCGLRQKYL